MKHLFLNVSAKYVVLNIKMNIILIGIRIRVNFSLGETFEDNIIMQFCRIEVVLGHLGLNLDE